MKFCNQCQKRKPKAKFHKLSSAKDGCQSMCISCKHKYQMSRRDIKRLYDANYREENREHLSIVKKEYRKTSKYKKTHATGVANYRKNNPEIYKAYNIVQVAKVNGTLIVQPCKECGSTKNIHAHHNDYSKPLDVEWLCSECHGKEHREL